MSVAITSSNFTFLVFLIAPLGSILCPLLFLIYIKNLSNHIVSAVKQFAAGDRLFFIAYNAKASADELNSHLQANLNEHSVI